MAVDINNGFQVANAILDQYTTANPRSYYTTGPRPNLPDGIRVLEYRDFQTVAGLIRNKLGVQLREAEDFLRLAMSKKPMGLGEMPGARRSTWFSGAGDTSYFDGEQTLLESIIRNQNKVAALDLRFLRLSQSLINARKTGNQRAMHLIPSVLRLYREWKEGQKDLPFMERDFDLWTNRAAGMESVAKSYGVTMAGDVQARPVRRRSLPQRRSNMSVELVGGCGHKSDLAPRDKAHLGGFASGGTFVGRWKPHVFKNVNLSFAHKAGKWVAVLKGATSGLPAAVSAPQPSKRAARRLALGLVRDKGWKIA